MKMDDFCNEVGIDQSKVMARFMGNESLYLRFVNKFLDDKNFEQLKDAVDSDDYEIIHMASHTLKGIAYNLGFDELGQRCDAVVKAVRAEQHELLKPLVETVGEEYTKIISLVKEEIEA